MTDHDVIIPSRGESRYTLLPTIQAFRACVNVRRIILIDDGDTEITPAFMPYLDTLLPGPREGKGAAVMVGLHASMSPRVVLCDGDLHGFKVRHAMRLVSGGFLGLGNLEGMVRGFTERVEGHPPWPVSAHIQRLVTGERSVPRELLDGLDLHGYAMEVQINRAAFRWGMKVRDVRLRGVRGTARWTDERGRAARETVEWLREQETKG